MKSSDTNTKDDKNQKYILYAEYIVNLCKNIISKEIKSIVVSLLVPVIRDTIKTSLEECFKNCVNDSKFIGGGVDKALPIHGQKDLGVEKFVSESTKNIENERMQIRNLIKQKMLNEYDELPSNYELDDIQTGRQPNNDLNKEVLYHNVLERDYSKFMKLVDEKANKNV